VERPSPLCSVGCLISARARHLSRLYACRPFQSSSTESGLRAGESVASKVLERISDMARRGSGVSTAQQAHFTALDGTVRVKKSNGNSWVPADYSTRLEKGDVVQTGPKDAKVVFNDGTQSPPP